MTIHPFLSIQLSLALKRITSWLFLTFPSRLLPQLSVYSSLASWGCLPKVGISLTLIGFAATGTVGGQFCHGGDGVAALLGVQRR